MNPVFQAFIFDMDGTIVSTNEDICDSVNFSLNKHGFPIIGYDECQSFLGNGSVKLIQRAMKGMRTEKFQEVFDDYFEHYLENYNVKTKPYDGLIEALEYSRSLGIQLFIYTNKPEPIALEIVNKVFPKNLFALTVGVPLGGKTKPDAAPFLERVKDFHLEYSKVAYFGDSVTDIRTAHNLEVGLTCSVLWGYQDMKTLKAYELQPDIYLDSPREIRKIACLSDKTRFKA